MSRFLTPLLALVVLSGCATARPPSRQAPASPATSTPPTTAAPAAAPAAAATRAGPAAPAVAATEAVAFPSTYAPLPARPTLIRNAMILTATGPAIENGAVLLRDGKVAAVGANVAAPADAVVIDGSGKWVTPGIIDTHSHMGVYAAPGIAANQDGNELTDPVTAQVWAEHSVWPQDPQFALALAGGITSLQVLPGSGNLIGGRGVTLKNVPARTVQGMKFPGAPYGLKMACGENPKRVYGERSRAPSTAMGNMAGYRAAWIRAAKYRDDLDRWRKDGSDPAKRPQRDLQLETLSGVLSGEILVQNHCYRGDEMAQMIDLAREFGYRIASFHHAVEAYKVRDLLARENICSSMWADWWGFKLEAYDGIQANIPLVHEAGACAIVHSDDAQGIQRLNQEAAKSIRAGREAGINVTREDAIRWITLNPAKALGIDRFTGSLEIGKMADLVLWSGDPFSVYSKAEKVFIDGALLYDRHDPRLQPKSDFILGLTPKVVTQ
jgi:imidazolonepropionase-like amidohydrolase